MKDRPINGHWKRRQPDSSLSMRRCSAPMMGRLSIKPPPFSELARGGMNQTAKKIAPRKIRPQAPRRTTSGQSTPPEAWAQGISAEACAQASGGAAASTTSSRMKKIKKRGMETRSDVSRLRTYDTAPVTTTAGCGLARFHDSGLCYKGAQRY